MKKFIKKSILFFLPLLICISGLVITYLTLDPFCVLWDYDFSKDLHSNASINRDFQTTEFFVQKYPQYHYNSFIFGSSRTFAFLPEDWEEYLPDNSSIFHFDASSESIYGIYTKLKYLENHNISIKNVLIILCRDCSFDYDKNQEGHLFIKHPLTSGENKMDSQIIFFKAFLNPAFLISYIKYSITKKYKPYMQSYVPNHTNTYDSITNATYCLGREQSIAENIEKYYEDKELRLTERCQTERIDDISRINAKQEKMLQEIVQILERNKTNYRVILSPLWEQIKWNEKDMKILKKCFDKNVYDFSGKNEYTDIKTNYYEYSHYRPIVGKSIMSEIYSVK